MVRRSLGPGLANQFNGAGQFRLIAPSCLNHCAQDSVVPSRVSRKNHRDRAAVSAKVQGPEELVGTPFCVCIFSHHIFGSPKPALEKAGGGNYMPPNLIPSLLSVQETLNVMQGDLSACGICWCPVAWLFFFFLLQIWLKCSLSNAFAFPKR